MAAIITLAGGVTYQFNNALTTITTAVPSDLPQVRVDSDQILLMALGNILANASEAIETTGHIRIICRTEVVTDDNIILK